jgi:hypothetical protein
MTSWKRDLVGAAAIFLTLWALWILVDALR